MNNVKIFVLMAGLTALFVAVGGTQFVTLDEPFTFVDKHRVRKTLEVLPNLSEEIAQVWIMASRFDADMGFALHLRCAGDSDTLIALGA